VCRRTPNPVTAHSVRTLRTPNHAPNPPSVSLAIALPRPSSAMPPYMASVTRALPWRASAETCVTAKPWSNPIPTNECRRSCNPTRSVPSGLSPAASPAP
jgi:hypothetical protein